MEAILNRSEFAPFLKDADHVDIKQIDARTSLRAFIAGMLSYYPWWVVLLYRVRQVLVGLLGLVRHDKPETLPCLTAEDISFTPGERATFFIVRRAEEENYWVSETPPDKHLSAYFGVAMEKTVSAERRFTVFTAIRYRHWTGPVYFNLIRPFHHLVVWRMMKAASKNHGFA
jgi:hypothetical protein